MLVSLTRITRSKVKIKWTKIEQDRFDEIKHIMACGTLLACPDFKEEFKIHTDARNFQLGASRRHKVKLIAFYSRKLTGSQKMYTVTEKDLLSIWEYRYIPSSCILRGVWANQ